MVKVKRKRVGDVGIRLKPVEKNLMKNLNELSERRKKTRKKKKKKIKKPKRTVTKSVEIQPKIDPLYKIMEESKDKPKDEIEVKELSDKDKEEKDKPTKEVEEHDELEEVEEPIFKKIQVHEGKQDLTKKDPNIKSLSITVSTEPEKKKKGHGIKLE
tara:strand:+ start:33 stop:503 length:471 start_codon:yes stop_codon:yes gene_type:complete